MQFIKAFFASLFFGLYLIPGAYCQSDVVGPGRAIRFDGVDDYIDLGDIYDNISFPITIEFWLKADPAISLAPVFVSQDNLPLYNGFWIGLTKTNLFLEYGDGRGENSGAYRNGVSSSISDLHGRWIHVAGVMKGYNDFHIYLNGVKLSTFVGGSSDQPMSSNFPQDHAKIGKWLSNGFHQYLKGELDEVRVWNAQRSESEIRQHMCRKLTGNENNLVGYWTFDEISGTIINDKTTNAFHGTLIGGAQRVYSGAPIGDESVMLYSNNWAGISLSMDNLKIQDVGQNPSGIHIYKVNSNPSQTGGLESISVRSPYYGVFVADEGLSYDYEVTLASGAGCGAYRRDDNADPSWIESTIQGFNVYQLEILPVLIADLEFDLGENKLLCDQPAHVISSGLSVGSRNFYWSNGANTPNIEVSETGWYKLLVIEGCRSDKDSVHIDFRNSVPPFSLGSDRVICPNNEVTLAPFNDPADLEFRWQDGSTEPTFTVSGAGHYEVTVKNVCGEKTAAVNFDDEPEVEFDLGNNVLICDQTSYTIASNLNVSDNITWNTGETTPAIDVDQTGWYKLTLLTQCRTLKDSVLVDFNTIVPAIDLGADRVICSNEEIVLSPINDPSGLEFTWQDGSTAPTYVVREAGHYAVTVKNVCSEYSSDIDFTEEPEVEFDLGENVVLCDQPSFRISSEFKTSDNLLWNTGQTTPSIEVAQTGWYKLVLQTQCHSVKDSIFIDFKKAVAPFSLGEDRIICPGNEITLPFEPETDYEVMWNDGSTNASLTVTESGHYSVTVKNSCSQQSAEVDLVVPAMVEWIPNVITPNDDGLNDTLILLTVPAQANLSIFNRWGREVDQASGYQNDWSGSNLPDGTYFWAFEGECVGKRTGTVSIVH